MCPIIPHDVIKETLRRKGVDITSNITFLRAGMTDPGYSHILSFRRQFYIKPECEGNLPDALQITYEDTTYWIYLTTDTTTCFVCKQEGHIARVCPTIVSSDDNIPDKEKESAITQPEIINNEKVSTVEQLEDSQHTEIVPADTNEIMQTGVIDFQMPPPLPSTTIGGIKRPLSSTSSSNPDPDKVDGKNSSSNEGDSAPKQPKQLSYEKIKRNPHKKQRAQNEIDS